MCERGHHPVLTKTSWWRTSASPPHRHHPRRTRPVARLSDAVRLRPARLTGPGPLAATMLVPVPLLVGFGPRTTPRNRKRPAPCRPTPPHRRRAGVAPGLPSDPRGTGCRSWARSSESCALFEAGEFRWRWACWSCQAVTRQRGVAQRPERRPPKPDAAGSTPAAPATSRASPRRHPETERAEDGHGTGGCRPGPSLSPAVEGPALLARVSGRAAPEGLPTPLGQKGTGSAWRSVTTAWPVRRVEPGSITSG